MVVDILSFKKTHVCVNIPNEIWEAFQTSMFRGTDCAFVEHEIFVREPFVRPPLSQNTRLKFNFNNFTVEKNFVRHNACRGSVSYACRDSTQERLRGGPRDRASPITPYFYFFLIFFLNGKIKKKIN